MQNPAALVMAIAYIAAAIAVFNGFLTTIGQARIACAALEGIARQPEARGSLTSSMIISLAFAETAGIYGLVVALIILFPNPILSNFHHLLV